MKTLLFIDTLFFKDTLLFIDTLLLIDTLLFIDTILFRDTLLFIDTLPFLKKASDNKIQNSSWTCYVRPTGGHTYGIYISGIIDTHKLADGHQLKMKCKL